MRQKNRFTRTGRYDRWLRLRRLAWLVPAFALVRVWMEFHTYFVEDIANAPTHLIGMVAVVCAAVMIVFIYSFIPFVLWWCVCTFFMSRSRREATFEPTSDLTYYRDTLKGLSAAQVSLLADLRIEPREDAAATLLSLERRGVLSTEGERVRVAEGDQLEALTRSELLLVELATEGILGPTTYPQWAELAEQEAIDGVHLQRIGKPKEFREAGCLGLFYGCRTGCLLYVATGILGGLFFLTIGNGLLELSESAENDMDIIHAMVANPMLVVAMLIMLVLFAFFMVAFLFPLIDTVRGLIENGDASRYLKRTPLGEREAECVYGIRNYVRDFTTLSDADRRALMLWDDFLVYAVALGQNQQVVDELVQIWKHPQPLE